MSILRRSSMMLCHKPELEKILENGRSFFVSLKESDEATKTLSKLIGDMIGIVFGTHFD